MQAKGTVEATSMSALETMLNVEEPGDAGCYYGRVKEQEGKLWTAAEKANDFMETTLNELICNEVQKQVKKKWGVIQNIIEGEV